MTHRINSKRTRQYVRAQIAQADIPYRPCPAPWGLTPPCPWPSLPRGPSAPVPTAGPVSSSSQPCPVQPWAHITAQPQPVLMPRETPDAWDWGCTRVPWLPCSRLGCWDGPPSLLAPQPQGPADPHCALTQGNSIVTYLCKDFLKKQTAVNSPFQINSVT